jgi:glycerol-3-phosphate dehydrogenase
MPPGGKPTTYRLMSQEIIDKVSSYLNAPVSHCKTAKEPLLESGEADSVSSVIQPPVTRSAVEVYCRQEWAVHLEDVMICRSRWHYYHKDRISVAEKVASWMAEHLGRNEVRLSEEIYRYSDILD